MFTGLVEEMGTLRGITRNGEAMVLHITVSTIMSDLKIGDSVSVNGVCLTASSLDANSFAADVMPETFRKSNLKDLQMGSKVNLERAMIANGRFGGHIVQGHVDGIGRIQHVTRNQNAVVYEITPASQNIFKYIIPKGSITLDGISLTVIQVKENTFEVSIIPHTLAQTVLNHKRAGDTVNIECDVLGKYVEHLLNYGSSRQQDDVKPSGIDMEYLAQNGFA
ncbi:riboflavin synthase [Paenibacillus macquariensis]|uniref:Riboflavin synthase n=1 Tax=Paenibacillus macquariensis TaxID=948756 RepID=A0ABY1JJX4_9BACL|nr:riboflavin synthase [Paenibacillus macquariensis]MEC0089817.1 riboflavin synthase [Paenibacillus macquariensis]OAB30943.1 riboflavin synthase subunit alpha [Paenibacillus macquariensis subsp. macquariensis]SIQ31836.1 riboflavin synthase alpha chain [Paenibacillus macquariensis]